MRAQPAVPSSCAVSCLAQWRRVAIAGLSEWKDTEAICGLDTTDADTLLLALRIDQGVGGDSQEGERPMRFGVGSITCQIAMFVVYYVSDCQHRYRPRSGESSRAPPFGTAAPVTQATRVFSLRPYTCLLK